VTTRITAALVTAAATATTVAVTAPAINGWLWQLSYWAPAALVSPLVLVLGITASAALYALVLRGLRRWDRPT
jgi:hypothetical protein